MLLDADYAAIEARIVCWLAGQEDALEEYRQGVDRYKRMAAFVYGIKEAEVNKFPQRFVGKGLILGAGFGLGAPKFRDSCKKPPGNYDLPEGLEFKAIKAWRKKHSKVVDFWGDLDDSAKSAVLHKGEVFPAGEHISFKCITTGDIEFLLMRLPSGRKLAYPWPKIVPGKFGGTTAVSFYQNLKGVTWGWNSGIWGGVWAENCLAGGTQVLSMQRGWINLQDLTAQDTLWDGVDFVQHRGLAAKGEQKVIDCHGVLTTPDHRFLVGGSWLNAQTARTLPIGMLSSSHGHTSSLAASQSFGTEIRQHDRNWERQWQWEEDDVGVPMHLRSESREDRMRASEKEEPPSGMQQDLPSLQGFRWGEKYDSRDDESSRLLGVAKHVGEVLESKASSVEKLWGSGDLSLHPLAVGIYELLERHGAVLPTWLRYRQEEQRWELHPKELSMGHAEKEHPESAKDSEASRSTIEFLGRSFSRRYQAQHTLLPAERRPDLGASLERSSGLSQQVYDILDCGPRQRFAVKAHDGRLLIAHNCTQAVAADIMCCGAQNAEDAGYEICALIHDQALAYHQGNQTPEEFVRLLTDLPSWAKGLPIAAEGSLAPFYRKE